MDNWGGAGGILMLTIDTYPLHACAAQCTAELTCGAVRGLSPVGSIWKPLYRKPTGSACRLFFRVAGVVSSDGSHSFW